MYEGERLEDMVQSIREHGVLNPVIVRKQKDGYEMLSGHNRQRAAMLAGIDKIPAIVKENLSDEDAIVYVIETNMIQRSFSELLPSEKAAVLAVRYEKISSQGKRNDILQEIAALNGQEGTCGHDVHKSRSRDELGSLSEPGNKMWFTAVKQFSLLGNILPPISNISRADSHSAVNHSKRCQTSVQPDICHDAGTV